MTKSEREMKQPLRNNKAIPLNQQSKSRIDKQRCRGLLPDQSKMASSEGVIRRLLHALEVKRPFFEVKLAHLNERLEHCLSKMKEIEEQLASDKETDAIELRAKYDAFANIYLPRIKSRIVCVERARGACCSRIRDLKSCLAAQSILSEAVLQEFSKMRIGGDEMKSEVVLHEFSRMCIGGDEKNDDGGATHKNL